MWILNTDVEFFYFSVFLGRGATIVQPKQASVSIAKEANTTVEAICAFSCSILGLIWWQATCKVSFCYILCSVLKYTIYGICRSEMKECNMLSLSESLRWWYCLCSSYAIGTQTFFLSVVSIGQTWDQGNLWQPVATCGISMVSLLAYTF